MTGAIGDHHDRRDGSNKRFVGSFPLALGVYRRTAYPGILRRATYGGSENTPQPI